MPQEHRVLALVARVDTELDEDVVVPGFASGTDRYALGQAPAPVGVMVAV